MFGSMHSPFIINMIVVAVASIQASKHDHVCLHGDCQSIFGDIYAVELLRAPNKILIIEW